MVKALRRAVTERLGDGEKYLAERGVDETAANAEFLMAEALGCGRADVHARADYILEPKQDHHFWDMIKRRGRRVPLAYVLGFQPFMDCRIKVNSSVLIPRPETEQLVEAVIELAGGKGAVHIVDVGTGSGCVSIALARRLPAAMIYATEISAAALKMAEENAGLNGVAQRIRFLCEDLFKPERRSSPWADIVVANPPYIPTAELKTLDKEVLREPFLALDGGKDGLDAVRAIAADAPRMLKPGGRLALEIGDGQADKVRGILERGGFSAVEIRRDLQRRERIALAGLPK
ncbi:MAG: peptide chain release factor N(5)-glutamine methyltransferase [Elusimicrobiota bacterium]